MEGGIKCLKLWPMGFVKLEIMAEKAKIFDKPQDQYSHVKNYLIVIEIWKYKCLFEQGCPSINLN